MAFSVEEQLEEARRELRQRQKVYPRWIGQGQITRPQAERRLALMEAIIETLEGLASKERLL